MKCDDFRKMLDEFATLDDGKMKQLNLHAEVCEECHGELEFLKSIINVSSSLPFPEPPVDLVTKVNDRIDKESVLTGRIIAVRRHLGRYIKQYSTVAACLALGLAIGLNSGNVKKYISGEENNGVISERTVSDNTVPKPAEKDEADENKEVTQADNSGVKEESTQKAEKSLPVPSIQPNLKVKVPSTPSVTVAPQPTVGYNSSADNKTEQNTQNNKSEQKSAIIGKSAETSAASVNVTENKNDTQTTAIQQEQKQNTTVTDAPTIVTEVPEANITESAEESEFGTYRIARGNYHLPEGYSLNTHTSATSAPETYSLNSEDYGIAVAQADEGEVPPGIGVKSSLSDKVIINSDDAERVSEIISEMNFAYSSGSYMAISSEFYKLLGRLDEEGIQYDYTLEYNTSENISFKIVTRN